MEYFIEITDFVEMEIISVREIGILVIFDMFKVTSVNDLWTTSSKLVMIQSKQDEEGFVVKEGGASLQRNYVVERNYGNCVRWHYYQS